nr:PREDICTED: uncharacterized protein LOC107983088 [Anolis carolinensis]|eukprot:XP_016850548.1 PREDICTED: uncharacterized protein LOC107983088 [Anolis carolinensis]
MGVPEMECDSLEELRSFSSLISRLAKALNLSTRQDPAVVDDPVFPREQQQGPTTTPLPLLPYLLRLLRSPDLAPSLIPAISRKADNLYRIDLASAEWLGKQLKPNSVVVDISQSRPAQRSQATRADREGKKLDAMGRKTYTSAGLFARMAHYWAYMGAYQNYLWNKIAPLLEHLPVEELRLARAFKQEACQLADLQKELAKHMVDSAGKLFANAIALRRHAWLRSAGLSSTARTAIEDLPLDESGLFNPNTDSNLERTHQMRQTAYRFGLPSHSSTYPGQRWPSYLLFQRGHASPAPLGSRPRIPTQSAPARRPTSSSRLRPQGRARQAYAPRRRV